MIRGLLERFTASSAERGAADEECSESRFVPLVLDASVRYAHGGSNTGLDGEISKLEEKARELEE